MSVRAPLLFALLLAACSHPPVRNTAPALALPVAPAPARAAAIEGWNYDVWTTPGATELSIEARFPIGTDAELAVEEGAEPFVRDLGVDVGGKWQTLTAQNGSWVVPSCRSEGCRIHYRFLLAEAAAALRDPDLASARPGVLIAPPSTWLVRPAANLGGRPFRLHVVTPPGIAFATGMAPSPSEPDTFHADIADLPIGPYSVFGSLEQSHLDVGARRLEIVAAPGDFAVGRRVVFDWIESSARVVERYFGRFPVERALLVLLPTEGEGFGYGKALGNGGASILLPIGTGTGRDDLRDDWTLVHEILHLGFPSLPREHIWLAEGIATYVEPIARARAGKLTEEAVWRGLVRGLPHGLPGAGDRGLDNTHTWGRTYWGGALFCLLADLEIRERTHNRFALDHALRAVLDQGGNIGVRWELGDVLDRGDAATGVHVLRDLHEKMGLRRHDVDLASLWKRLGIQITGETVTFDDKAPLAAVRRSITSVEPYSPSRPPSTN